MNVHGLLKHTNAVHCLGYQQLRGPRKRPPKVQTHQIWVCWCVPHHSYGMWRAGEISFGMN